MSQIPKNLRYAKTHEWAREEKDGTVTIGITDYAQEQLGDLVFVELPEVGTKLTAGKDCAVVESVKAASDVYAPVGGEVAAANAALPDSPENVNKDPYGEGWMFRIRLGDKRELDKLMDAKAYEALVASAAH
jgi:glycine cleavage system H protein